jgi:crotonyl-CoA carboxylase/reductase
MPPTSQNSQVIYAGPAFEDATVHDAMNVGLVTCRPETSLGDVARMMTGYGMHAIVVADVEGGNRAWGIVTSLDLARAGDDLRAMNAGDVAQTELITIASDEPLVAAARQMAEHRVSHLLVLQPDDDQPVGVISTSAITAAIGASA